MQDAAGTPPADDGSVDGGTGAADSQGGDGGTEGDGGDDGGDVACALLVADDFDLSGIGPSRWTSQSMSCASHSVGTEVHGAGSAASFACGNGNNAWNYLTAKATGPAAGRRTELHFAFKASGGDYVFAVLNNGLGELNGLSFARSSAGVVIGHIDDSSTTTAPVVLDQWPLPMSSLDTWHTIDVSVTFLATTSVITAKLDGSGMKQLSVPLPPSGAPANVGLRVGIDHFSETQAKTSIDDVRFQSCMP